MAHGIPGARSAALSPYLFNLPFVRKEVIQAWWGQIIKQDRPFTRIEMIHSHKALMGYVSKYVAKVNPAENSGFNSLTYLHAYQQKHGEEIGRMWGVFERDNLPMARLIVIERDYVPHVYYTFRKLAASVYPPIDGYISPGFRLYAKSAKRWYDIARHLFDKPAKTQLLRRLVRSDIPLTI